MLLFSVPFSCDGYTYDKDAAVQKCPYFTQTSNFAQLQAALQAIIGTLTAEVGTFAEVIIEENVSEENVTDEIEVLTCEKNTDFLLLALLLLPLLIWLMAVPT